MLLKSDFCCLELLEDFEIYLMMYIGPPKYQGLGMHIQLCTHPVLATNTELNSLLMGRLLTTQHFISPSKQGICQTLSTQGCQSILLLDIPLALQPIHVLRYQNTNKGYLNLTYEMILSIHKFVLKLIGMFIIVLELGFDNSLGFLVRNFVFYL